MSSTRRSGSLVIKRGFDIFCSGIGLVILAPIFGVIALAVRLDSPGPVLYSSSRVGREGKIFHIHKFRTMVVNADQVGPAVTLAQDKRVTRAGRYLRAWKLDELPQLINVWTGSMSLVGPRPESPIYVEFYTPQQRHVLDVRPGITSLASVSYRHEEALLASAEWEATYIHEIMPAKLELDLQYVDQMSMWQDIKIILDTLIAIFR